MRSRCQLITGACFSGTAGSRVVLQVLKCWPGVIADHVYVGNVVYRLSPAPAGMEMRLSRPEHKVRSLPRRQASFSSSICRLCSGMLSRGVEFSSHTPMRL